MRDGWTRSREEERSVLLRRCERDSLHQSTEILARQAKHQARLRRGHCRRPNALLQESNFAQPRPGAESREFDHASILSECRRSCLACDDNVETARKRVVALFHNSLTTLHLLVREKLREKVRFAPRLVFFDRAKERHLRKRAREARRDGALEWALNLRHSSSKVIEVRFA